MSLWQVKHLSGKILAKEIIMIRFFYFGCTKYSGV